MSPRSETLAISLPAVSVNKHCVSVPEDLRDPSCWSKQLKDSLPAPLRPSGSQMADIAVECALPQNFVKAHCLKRSRRKEREAVALTLVRGSLRDGVVPDSCGARGDSDDGGSSGC
jgi:hypothetical protein